MKNNLLNIKGVSVISKEEQKQITGAIDWPPVSGDASKCGCDCAGRVTGPFYCYALIACLQVYTCNDTV